VTSASIMGDVCFTPQADMLSPKIDLRYVPKKQSNAGRVGRTLASLNPCLPERDSPGSLCCGCRDDIESDCVISHWVRSVRHVSCLACSYGLRCKRMLAPRSPLRNARLGGLNGPSRGHGGPVRYSSSQARLQCRGCPTSLSKQTTEQAAPLAP
jgi:hypothetical protein